MTITEHPLANTNDGTAPLPYWLDRPCPPWCKTEHHYYDRGEDRVHSSGGAGPEIELTLEPRVEIGGQTFPAHIGGGMWMHYRDVRPHVYLLLNDREEILLEQPEALELGRLLADPPNRWASLTLTMMEPDSVMPSGFRAEGKPACNRVAHLAASPFTRTPVAAVRQELDSVTVFCPVQTPKGCSQPLRYLTLTPGEAAELSAMIARLLDRANVLAQDTALSPVEAPALPAAGPCPPWCEIDDHDDFDGAAMRHSTWTNVALSSYPYEVTSTESGQPVTTQHSDTLIVSRVQLRDHAPGIVISPPDVVPGTDHCADPDGHVGPPAARSC